MPNSYNVQGILCASLSVTQLPGTDLSGENESVTNIWEYYTVNLDELDNAIQLFILNTL